MLVLDVNHLKYFYTVAKEGSFTKAANSLRVQQPTVSKMIRSLEMQLGFVLIERGKKGITLTNSGTRVFKLCQEIFERVEQIVNCSDPENQECVASLNFGANDGVSSHLMPTVLSVFLRDHPKARPSIFSGNSTLISREIIDGKIDFGLFFAAPEPGGFELTELFQVKFELVVATAVLERQDIEQVTKRLIVPREIDYGKFMPPPALQMLKRNGISFDHVITTNTYDSQKMLVQAGLGAALLPSFMVFRELRNGKLKAVYPNKSFFTSLKLIKRNGKILSKNSSVFLDYVGRLAPSIIEPT